MSRSKEPQLPGFDKARSKARGSRGAGCKWRCHKCGEMQVYWARAERHADEQRHYRIELVLGTAA